MVKMKRAFKCPNSDMGVVWGLLCFHPNTIKPSYYYYYYYYYYYSPLFLSVAHKLVHGRSQLLMVSDFNENWYLGLFWSEVLIGNDENCIQGHFYFQNGRWQNRQIVNGLRFQWKLISRSILKWGIGWCPEFWYGFFLGTSVFASKHNQT